MITPPLWHFSKNSSDFVAGPFPKVQKKKRDFAAQICRGYVYILPIIFISILYNIPKFYEVETTTHCQLELDGMVSFRILKKKNKNKDNHPLSATTRRNVGRASEFRRQNKFSGPGACTFLKLNLSKCLKMQMNLP